MARYYLIPLLMLILASSVFASQFPSDYIGAEVITGKTASSTDLVTGSRLASSVRGISTEFGIPSYVNGNLTGYGTLFQIKANGNMLEGAENVDNVVSSVNKNMFALLKDGTFSTSNGQFNFEQTLAVPYHASSAYQYADDIPNDYTNTPSGYMTFPKDAAVYSYTASFFTEASSRIDSSSNSYKLKDFEDGKINLLGKDFTVLKAEHPALNSIKLTLISGAVKDTLKEGEKKDYVINGTMYTVEVVAITDTNSSSVFFRINNETLRTLKEGESERYGTIYVAVSDIIPNEAGDVTPDFVEFYLDAFKLELTDTNTASTTVTNEFKVNDKTIYDTDVQISCTDPGLVEGSNFKIKSITFSWTPTSKYYLGTEKYLSSIAYQKDALFGNLDYYYYGSKPDNDVEVISLTESGSNKYNLNFENILGEKLEIPLFYYNSGFSRFGKEDYPLVVDEGTQIAKNYYFVVTSDGYKDATKAEGTTKFYRYKKQDINEKFIILEDLGSGKLVELYYDSSNLASMTVGDKSIRINVTSNSTDGNITVDLNGDGSIDAGDVPVLVTKYQGKIVLDTTAFNNFQFISLKAEEGPGLETWAPYGVTEGHDYTRISVQDNSGIIDITNVESCLSFNYDEILVATGMDYVTTQYLLESCYVTFTSDPYKLMYKVGDTDVYEGSGSWGQFYEWYKNKNNPDQVYIASTKKQDEALFFIVDKDASFHYEEDSSSDNVSTKKILMGGPCVNEDTAKAMGLAFPSCGGSVIKPDSAFIKEYDYNGGKALVVFGYGPEDTINAVNKLMNSLKILDKGMFIQGDVITEAPASIAEEKKVEVTTTTTMPVVVAKGSKCSYSSHVKSEYVTDTRKFGMSAKTTTYVKIDMQGLNGKLDVSDEKPFEAAFGVDYLDFTVHILKGSCTGQEVQKFTAHQANGDQTFIFDVKASEEGCYCVKIDDSDLIIDSAKIKILDPGKFEMMFGTG